MKTLSISAETCLAFKNNVCLGSQCFVFKIEIHSIQIYKKKYLILTETEIFKSNFLIWLAS